MSLSHPPGNRCCSSLPCFLTAQNLEWPPARRWKAAGARNRVTSYRYPLQCVVKFLTLASLQKQRIWVALRRRRPALPPLLGAAPQQGYTLLPEGAWRRILTGTLGRLLAVIEPLGKREPRPGPRQARRSGSQMQGRKRESGVLAAAVSPTGAGTPLMYRWPTLED
jgi:hypothetical protein